MFRADDQRTPAARARALAAHAAALARLPRPVLRFYLRGLRHARAHGDRWSTDVVARPRELGALLDLADGRKRVAEIGTGTGWTALALALADDERTVTTFDVLHRAHRDAYFALVPPRVRKRVRALVRPGEDPPPDIDGVDLLFIDGAHDEAANVKVFEAWRDRLAPGALVLFHDYGDPAYPGVAAAVERLGLPGVAHGRLYAAEP